MIAKKCHHSLFNPGSCNDGPVEPYGGGGGCGPMIPGTSFSEGFVNYFLVSFLSQKRDFMAIRNDILNDARGQRTGFATWYSSHTIGWTHFFTDTILIRPELRYERAYQNVTPYDNGTKKDQLKGAMDLIIRF